MLKTVGNPSVRTGDQTIDNGNLVIGKSGNGIDFTATASGTGTPTSELLSDYEEGTWTASFGASTAPGRYTKIGRVVFVTLVITTKSESFSSISGLPYAVSSFNFSGNQGAFYFGRAKKAVVIDAAGNECRAYASGTSINFRTNPATAVDDAAFTITTAATDFVELVINGFYFA